MQTIIRFVISSVLSNSNSAYTKDPIRFHIAPMQGYTNASLRNFFHELSPSSIKWTEMEKVQDLMPSNSINELESSLRKRFGSKSDFSESGNLILQLGGSDPHMILKCAERCIDMYGFREINLNCGCPSIESGGAASFGASLMKNVDLTSRLVQSLKSAGDNVEASVKCRVAVMDNVDDQHDLTDKDYEYLSKYVDAIQGAGGSHVIIHARPAVLSGLSPVKNRQIPKLNYKFVERLSQDFTDVRITLNGGIKSEPDFEKLRRKYSCDESFKIDGLMAGRWILRRPLDLVCIESALSGEEIDYMIQIQKAIQSYGYHAVQVASSKSCETPFSELCLPIFLLIEHLKELYNQEHDFINDNLSLSNHHFEVLYDDIQAIICELESIKGKRVTKKAEGINLKKLSSSLKDLVGIKVFNKWKRNRMEI